MGLKQLFLSLIILLICGGIVVAQTNSQISFAEAKSLPDKSSPERFEFSALNAKFTINGKGKGAKTKTSKVVFRLKTDGGDVQRIYFAEHQNDLLLAYELNYGGEGNGFVVRLDGNTLRPKWRAMIEAFNFGQGLIEKEFAYLTAIGYVAKINLDSGKFVWKHANLYGKSEPSGAYNNFILPKLEGNNVLFQEETIYDRTPKTVKVNKTTGKIISF